MDRSDSRAGKHRDCGLRNQRQIDRDAISLFYAETLEDIRELGYLAIKIPIGQRPSIARLALPKERCFVPPRSSNMSVDAVGRDIDLSAGEPLRMRRGPLQYIVPGFYPFQLTRLFGPEFLGVACHLLQNVR